VGWADGPRDRGRQSKNEHRTSSMHPPKFGRSASSPWTVRSSRTVLPHWADDPANNFQPKPTGQTDRNEVTQELMKNMTNNRLLSSSRTVHRPRVDGPPGMGTLARARAPKGQPFFPFAQSPESTKGFLPNHR
jgi:hypothetical protein